MMPKRGGIALLITLFFIIALTAAIGISLTNLQKSGEELHETRFMLQSAAIVEDVIILMKEADKLGVVTDTNTLGIFLLSAGFIPLELKELLVKIEITSAMGRVNINSLSRSKEYREAFLAYMARYNVQDPYYMIDLLQDCMGGKKDVYKTNIFDELPELYHERIVSRRHLNKIIDFYTQERHDNAVATMAWHDLVRFDESNVSAIDANYVTPALWQLLLPTLDDEKAVELSDAGGMYSAVEDLSLGQDEEAELKKFKLSFFEPVVQVDIVVLENNTTAHIVFDYDITKKKGNHFEFGI